MNWRDLWTAWLGFPAHTPSWILAVTAIMGVYILYVLPVLAVCAVVRRKFTAVLQARVGPNLTGPAGLFQSVADFMKLLQKNGFRRLSHSEVFWFSLSGVSLYSTLTILPLSESWIMVDDEMTAFLPLWLASVSGFSMLMFGLEQKSLPGVFGGLRNAAQVFTCLLPALLSTLSVGLHSGGFQWKQIIDSQGGTPWSWNLFSDPFQWASFLVFLCCGPILLCFEPQDSSSGGARDLGGGLTARLSGGELALLKLRELYALFLWAVLASTLFLGAWKIPESLHSRLDSDPTLLWIVETLALLMKSGLLMLVIHWISVASPRVRSDQLFDFSLKVLGPISIMSLIFSTLWMIGKGLI